nr:hypothetical protein GCM10025699_20880 [Microbacterium flavescens]
MPDDADVLSVPAPLERLGDARLLRVRHEVVDEHAVPTGGRRRLFVEHRLEQIDALQVLDHDALGPQVVSPHLLDELGIMAALDEDAARPRDAGT